MPLSKSRDYYSIGEVLELLRPEFPDVSISKLRFLESEALVTPERTPSGYRKFFTKDVDRLRHILTLQRDQFLPLKVIRKRLEAGAGDSESNLVVEVHTLAAAPSTSSEAPPASVRANAASGSSSVDLTGAQLSRQELTTAADLSDEGVTALEEFGLLQPRDEDAAYNEDDLMVARAASGFFRHGLEARHLRMYRQFADREATFYGQIVSPLARRKDSESRARAYETLQELVELSRRMREGMLRSSMRGLP
ncbi:MAG: MerR family transcriptional regulator [Actinomycetota bacterium]|nr:MerR family transcriptional regulator [Actinomycetota bacterium]